MVELQESNRGNVFGPKTAPLELIEYGDYQCPTSRHLHPIIKQITSEMGESMRYIFRHFPLTQIHPHALRAAEAAECAGAQGRFWEMHDCLFCLDSVDEARLVHCAHTIGLDVIRFLRNMAGHLYAAGVQLDQVSGEQHGVFATPTLFINGIRYDGALAFDALKAALDDALRERHSSKTHINNDWKTKP